MNHSIRPNNSMFIDVIAALVLFALAACFAASLGAAALGFDSTGAALGRMILDAYGFCAVLVPAFLLAAGVVCFIGNWTAARAVRLLTACVPFFTLVATESTCRSIFALGADDFTNAKVSVTIALGVMLVIIEYLGAGIIGEQLLSSRIHGAGGSAESAGRQSGTSGMQKAFRTSGSSSLQSGHSYDSPDDMLDELDDDYSPTVEESVDEEGVASPSPFDDVFDEKGQSRAKTADASSPASREDGQEGVQGAEQAAESEDAAPIAAGSVITEEEYNALTREETADAEDEISWDNLGSGTIGPVDETISDEELHTIAAEKKNDSEDGSLNDAACPLASHTANRRYAADDAAEDGDAFDAKSSEEHEEAALLPDAEQEGVISSDDKSLDDEAIPLDEEEDTPDGEEAALDEDFFDIDVNDPDADEEYEDEVSSDAEEGEAAEAAVNTDEPVMEGQGAAHYEVETSPQSAAEVFAEMDADVRRELGMPQDGLPASAGLTAGQTECSETDEGEDALVCAPAEQDEISPFDIDAEGSSDEGSSFDEPIPDPRLLDEEASVSVADEVPPASATDASALAPSRAAPAREGSPARPRRTYSVPTSLLTEYADDEYWLIDAGTQRASLTLKETLGEFHIEADVVGIRKGPVVTMFELLPAPGVKLSKIVALQDNIALRLAASSVRIVAPIPGKKAVGIEIPNKKRSIVGFREVIEQDMPEFKNMAVPVILGKDILGKPQIIDLVKMPHLLIAGATGAGKSVCVNSMILSILYKRAPEDVKLILIDPKVVELKLYNDIPHLLVPVITETKKALQALQWALCEMERRYAMLDRMGCREIASYNKKIADKNIAAERMPYIIIIIDEFADLMATSGKELESTVARLAAMSRAVGIHLVLATQRPSIDVITGLIKANIPSRIAFMVASKTDSRIIIDQVGAEKLLGKGDMLYASAADPYPTRIQGTFVSDQEVENVVDCVKQYDTPDYIEEEVFVSDDDDGDSDPSEFGDGEDPLYDEALQIVMQAGKASASYIQRRLKIGYNRAARLVEDMETRGIVGPANGSKPREIVHVP